jgi:hypothetical protein
MLNAYLVVVARRSADPYAETDLKVQDDVRKNWLEDRFFSDPDTTAVTPYDAWSLCSLPSTVKL